MRARQKADDCGPPRRSEPITAPITSGAEQLHRHRVGSAAQRVWAIIRISLCWLILWPFLDGMFALGFPTGRVADGSIDFFNDSAWFNGGSPTARLETVTKGPFAGLFRSVAGEPWLD